MYLKNFCNILLKPPVFWKWQFMSGVLQGNFLNNKLHINLMHLKFFFLHKFTNWKPQDFSKPAFYSVEGFKNKCRKIKPWGQDKMTKRRQKLAKHMLCTISLVFWGGTLWSLVILCKKCVNEQVIRHCSVVFAFFFWFIWPSLLLLISENTLKLFSAKQTFPWCNFFF